MKELECKESTNVAWARYWPETETLEIDFKDSKTGKKVSTYAYEGFSAEDWAAFEASESKGRHFAYTIRPQWKGRKLPHSGSGILPFSE